METKDILGMVIATTSVIITVLAVFVAFLLSRNYLQSIKEIEEIRRSSDDLAEKISSLTNVNSTLLRESMLAVRSMFDLLMILDRKSHHLDKLETLVARREWNGRPLGDDELETYKGRIAAELANLQGSILARQTELYWLVGQDNERAAHLHALSNTRGDLRTIQLLEDIRAIRASGEERDELLVAITGLRVRLGRPARSRVRRYNSRAWTG